MMMTKSIKKMGGGEEVKPMQLRGCIMGKGKVLSLKWCTAETMNESVILVSCLRIQVRGFQ